MPTLEEFLRWASDGRRGVSIEITTQLGSDPEYKVWVYDFNVAHGCFVGVDEGLPSTADLADKRRAELMKQLDELAA